MRCSPLSLDHNVSFRTLLLPAEPHDTGREVICHAEETSVHLRVGALVYLRHLDRLYTWFLCFYSLDVIGSLCVCGETTGSCHSCRYHTYPALIPSPSLAAEFKGCHIPSGNTMRSALEPSVQARLAGGEDTLTFDPVRS